MSIFRCSCANRCSVLAIVVSMILGVAAALEVLLTGVLGTVLFSAVLLAVRIVATGVLSAIAVGS